MLNYFRLFIEWIIFIAILIFGVYTMIIIKNEKKKYLTEAIPLNFKNFKLLIPKWWGEFDDGDKSENKICFKRLDTRYEWEAKFIWSPFPSEKDIIELFKDHIVERKILFDEDTSIVYNPSDFQNNSLIKSGKFEMVRLEGTATCDRQERLYYDAFLIKNKNTKQFLYAESKSSVLNGLVEGPYFEEVMNQIEYIE